MEVLSGLAEERGIAVVLALHDLNLAATYCHRLLVMKAGSVYGYGAPAEVLNEEMLERVYGIQAVIKRDLAAPYVVPVRSGRLQGGA
jgi:iron complex transport system ATP-binding protein